MEENDPKPLHGLNVVCADDETIALTILAELLTSAGATVRTAKDGEQALKVIRSHPTDAVLLDIQMPVMDGVTAMKILRAEGFKQPIIAVTAASKHEAQKLIDSGADHYFSKPVIAHELIEVIKNSVHHS